MQLEGFGGNMFGNFVLARHCKNNCYARINLNYEKASTLIDIVMLQISMCCKSVTWF
jgi:hypothetical protein